MGHSFLFSTSPSVSIVPDPPTGPIYESTSYLLTCKATVNTTIVNTPVTASVLWTDPRGNVIPTNETRWQVIPPTGNSLVSMLLFQPIDTDHNNDGGTYTCQMIINSDNSLVRLSQPTNTTLDATVESKYYVLQQIPCLLVLSSALCLTYKHILPVLPIILLLIVLY